MPNTKSAERRMRNSARKNLQNRSVKSRLHTLEKDYLELLGAGKKEDAAEAKRLLGWETRIRFRDLVRIMIDADMEKLGLPTSGNARPKLENGHLNWLQRP